MRERGKGGGNFLGQESSLNVWKYGRNLKVSLGRGGGVGGGRITSHEKSH